MLAPIRISVVLLLICGLVYPVVVTLVGGAILPYQANGSIVTDSSGNPIGSELIAQSFTQDYYFHPRPSAAGSNGYDPTSSGGSNLGPTNQALIDRVTKDASALKEENPNLTVLPADLLTTSGSGLDPDISPEGAMAQVPRVAKARGISEQQLTDLVNSHVTPPDLGIFGVARINVLKLNLALDAAAPVPQS
ncbi:MAG: potassium-transporting ATPase subunit KdpC [Chloroflexi bacterium]|nr:potassium-transporting ATPase subunit KdpC [Chloroflexota bacterium]MBV9135361.1 potassium-transporting ATPase subunit KdpC [Chloroflexota bacterium]MBV9892613.1 potassium-transporting ATPase subunit KdpC [Chloroflexota bacterium]